MVNGEPLVTILNKYWIKLKNNILLKKGIKYSICSCGISKRLPFCDGGHRILNEKGDANYKSVKITAHDDINLSFNCANWENEN